MITIQICQCPSHGKNAIFPYACPMVIGILTYLSHSKNPDYHCSWRWATGTDNTTVWGPLSRAWHHSNWRRARCQDLRHWAHATSTPRSSTPIATMPSSCHVRAMQAAMSTTWENDPKPRRQWPWRWDVQPRPNCYSAELRFYILKGYLQGRICEYL
jgi:hypothetical protein